MIEKCRHEWVDAEGGLQLPKLRGKLRCLLCGALEIAPDPIEAIRVALAGADASRGPGAPVSEGHQQLAALIAEVDRLRAKVAELEDSACMACEQPAENCQCCGCLYASEYADRENAKAAAQDG